jgi:hypothetical protein
MNEHQAMEGCNERVGKWKPDSLGVGNEDRGDVGQLLSPGLLWLPSSPPKHPNISVASDHSATRSRVLCCDAFQDVFCERSEQKVRVDRGPGTGVDLNSEFTPPALPPQPAMATSTQQAQRPATSMDSATNVKKCHDHETAIELYNSTHYYMGSELVTVKWFLTRYPHSTTATRNVCCTTQMTKAFTLLH